MTKYIVRNRAGWAINFQPYGYGIAADAYATRFDFMTLAVLAMLQGNLWGGSIDMVQ